ncbi:MAG: NAD(P)/FAD-dependent oxidoreductase [Verrucomicrobiota bacterium]
MADKSILIIGAGIAGLATGSYGRMNGYRTRILEHHSEPGGVAKAWKNNGYLVDGGIHYLMGHRPGLACHDIYRELGLFTNRKFPDLDTFVHFRDEVTGRSISFTGDLEKMAKDLKDLAPEDARFVDRFIRGIKAFQKTDIFGNLATPPELMRLPDFVRQFWRLRHILPYFGGPFNQPMEDYVRGNIRNECLQRILANLFLPEVPVWFVLLILSLLASRQLGLLEGSCKDFVESMEERYRQLGGEITYNATVKEVIVENNRAVGVRLADGSEQRADVIVAAGDGYSTLFKLLGNRYTSPKLKECYQNWQHLVPVVTMSFGVAQEYPDQRPLQFLLLKKPMTIGNVTINGFPVRIFNYSPKFSPAGRTIVQALVHSDWEYWEELLKDRPAYEEAKKRVVAETLERLEAHYPGITAKVELTDIATPYTTWRYTLNHKGAFMGWVPTPKALRTLLPKTLPGLENFYMAGQWIMPGGGVPPCLYSGRHVLQLLCKRDGKKFTTTLAD